MKNIIEIEAAGTGVETRQRINDDCDRFVIEMLEGLSDVSVPNLSR